MRAIIVIVVLILPLIYANPACSLCHWAVRLGRNLAQATISPLIKVVKLVCSHYKTPEYCELLIGNFRKPVEALFNSINGNITCYNLFGCVNPRIVKDEDFEYFSRVLTSIPPRLPYVEGYDQSNTYKILVFTDAHMDFNYTEGRSVSCDYDVCCRGDSPITDDKNKQAPKYGYIGRCDLPQITIDSFIHEVAKLNPDAVLGLGDYNGHNGYEQTKDTHLKAVTYIANNLRGNYSGPVYLVTGNHDGFPDGQFDVWENESSWITEGYAKLARYWFSDEGVKNVRNYGRFSEVINGTRLRIIGLNNFVMDFTNLYMYKNSTDAFQQLKWFEEQLETSKKNKQFVIVIGHVAPQSKAGERTWGIRYAALMEKYANIVKGQFFGHMHEDYFYPIMSFFNSSELVNVVHIHPALTTFSGVNPSFRIYEIDKDNYEMRNYHQYRLDVTKQNGTEEATWKIAHNFTSLHEFKNMNPKNYLTILGRMKNSPDYFDKMYRIKYTEGPKGHPPTNAEDRAKVMCEFTTAYLNEYFQCMNGSFSKTGDLVRMIVGKYIFPDWKYAV